MIEPRTPEIRVAAIVLAAGGSTRMGRPKLALPVRGVPMIRRAAQAALESGCGEAVVVLGTHGDLYRALLDGLRIRMVENPEPGEGMGSSIRVGVEAISQDADGAVILLADQPFVTSSTIDRLIDAAAAGARIAASAYCATIGPPAYFHRGLFPELLALEGDRGARSVILAHPGEVVTVPLPEADATDVDTRDDLSAIGEEP